MKYLGSAVHMHCLDASVGWRAVSYGSSVGEKPSFCCTAFTGPTAHQSKEPITVSQVEQLVACKADAMASLYNIRSVVI